MQEQCNRQPAAMFSLVAPDAVEQEEQHAAGDFRKGFHGMHSITALIHWAAAGATIALP